MTKQEDDATIREKLLNRYPNLFERPTEVGVCEVPFDGPGRPRADWHEPAFAEVDRLLQSEGMSINKACKRVRDSFEAMPNVTYDSFRQLYRRYKQEQAEQQFVDAVLDAVLSPRFKKKFGLK